MFQQMAFPQLVYSRLCHLLFPRVVKIDPYFMLVALSNQNKNTVVFNKMKYPFLIIIVVLFKVSCSKWSCTLHFQTESKIGTFYSQANDIDNEHFPNFSQNIVFYTDELLFILFVFILFLISVDFLRIGRNISEVMVTLLFMAKKKRTYTVWHRRQSREIKHVTFSSFMSVSYAPVLFLFI